MNIAEIKAQIGLTSLMMVRQMDQDSPEKPTEWVSHWDNDRRIRVTMHEEILDQLKADPNKADLAVKKKVVLATEERAEYTRYVVITPQHVEATL